MDEDVLKDDEVGSTFLNVGNLIIKGGVDDWFEIYFKKKSAGKVHLATSWVASKKANIEEHKESRPSMPAARPSMTIPEGNHLKML